jgi:hypothetical protein
MQQGLAVLAAPVAVLAVQRASLRLVEWAAWREPAVWEALRLGVCHPLAALLKPAAWPRAGEAACFPQAARRLGV